MSIKYKLQFGIYVLGVLLLNSTTNQVAQAKQQFRFGIVPQSSGSKLSRTWTPILAYLAKETGYDLEFATARNIPTFEKRLHDGKYDLAYMNPYHYTQVNSSTGYQAFAKAKNKRLKGILVVRKDSPYQDINDLSNKELAFPSNAFAASQVPRAIFNGFGLNVTAKFVSSHDSVYRNVAKGRYPAGGGVMRTFKNAAPEIREQLRILWTSDGFTPHAFAAHPRVPNQAIERLQNAMLAMEQDPKGRVLLKSIRLKGVEVGLDGEWNDVRALSIEN
ncbi:MAG: phosphate/phosphite/phosphonate ABC transporter substrate-binding protein [Thioalkalispiraceae bacterium]|jgi:phosphonate transport system substrate-binding protein